MLLTGKRYRLCDGLSRRQFLKIGALGSLSLADVLRLRAASPTARPRSVIMLWLCGGPSQLDTYDLKPDAPVEVRGEFKSIATNVPGVHISEHLPLQARMWDKFSVIRSVIPVDGGHSDAGVTTGFSAEVIQREHRPSVGSVIARLRDGTKTNIPHYVSLRGDSPSLDAGYLGNAYRPFTPKGPDVDNLKLHASTSRERLDSRKDLLASFDSVRRDIDASGNMDGMDAYRSRAFDMIVSEGVRHALDLSREDPRSRERYKGVEQFLTARRLIEAGVGCVTLGIGGSVWDTHHYNFKTLKEMLPSLDRALTNLVGDLHERGLDQDVVTIACGEFGRTPRINKDAGRDHWGPVMSVLLAGGGLKMGQMIGSTDAHASRPKDRPYHLQQVLSTVYRAIGIDAGTTLPDGSGRPQYLLNERDPVVELL